MMKTWDRVERTLVGVLGLAALAFALWQVLSRYFVRGNPGPQTLEFATLDPRVPPSLKLRRTEVPTRRSLVRRRVAGMSGIDRSLSSKSEQDTGMRSANKATQSRRMFLNIGMLLRISAALLITFGGALALIHAEFYCFGMLQSVGSQSSMPGPAYLAPGFSRAWE
jgi:hypothetical protein